MTEPTDGQVLTECKWLAELNCKKPYLPLSLQNLPFNLLSPVVWYGEAGDISAKVQLLPHIFTLNQIQLDETVTKTKWIYQKQNVPIIVF